jgi:hypothetical protein
LARLKAEQDLPNRVIFGEVAFGVFKAYRQATVSRGLAEATARTLPKAHTMGDIKRQPLWERRYRISPVVATLLGIAIGCTLATLSALMPPRDFSYRFLTTLLIILGPCGGIFAYVLWLLGDPTRSDRFQRIMGLVASFVIPGLLVACSILWWHTGRSRGSLPVVIALGAACCSAILCAVAAGWGMFHLVHHVASSNRQSSKPAVSFRTDALWDRELDEG